LTISSLFESEISKYIILIIFKVPVKRSPKPGAGHVPAVEKHWGTVDNTKLV
jgi:hypothetical protein